MMGHQKPHTCFACGSDRDASVSGWRGRWNRHWGSDPALPRQFLPSSLTSGGRSGVGPCHHAAPGGTSQYPARVSFQGILSVCPQLVALILTRTAKPTPGPRSHFIVLR